MIVLRRIYLLLSFQWPKRLSMSDPLLQIAELRKAMSPLPPMGKPFCQLCYLLSPLYIGAQDLNTIDHETPTLPSLHARAPLAAFLLLLFGSAACLRLRISRIRGSPQWLLWTAMLTLPISASRLRLAGLSLSSPLLLGSPPHASRSSSVP